MDMSWQALLQEAAATSFEKTADTLAAAENDNCACIDLHQQQIHELSKKILLLPHQGRVLLLSRYCFRLSPEETEMFFHLENAKGHFRFYKELLSSSMGVEAGCMISDDIYHCIVKMIVGATGYKEHCAYNQKNDIRFHCVTHTLISNDVHILYILIHYLCTSRSQ